MLSVIEFAFETNRKTPNAHIKPPGDSTETGQVLDGRDADSAPVE
jgi:hypothetical protein